MSSGQVVREATHAGSWYTDSKSQLNSQLESWLNAVNPPVTCIGPNSEGHALSDLPVPGARMIIAPYVDGQIFVSVLVKLNRFRHAGYSYSGPAAAWAYKAWDVSKA